MILALGVYLPSISSANTGEAYVGADLATMDDETGWKVFGGYGINENISVEAGYASYASEKDKGTGVKASITGFELGASLKLPLEGKLGIIGKAGITFWKLDFDGAGIYYDIEEDGNDFFIGVAGEYKVQNNLNIRGGVDKYIGDLDDARLSVGVIYKFK